MVIENLSKMFWCHIFKSTTLLNVTPTFSTCNVMLICCDFRQGFSLTTNRIDHIDIYITMHSLTRTTKQTYMLYWFWPNQWHTAQTIDIKSDLWETTPIPFGVMCSYIKYISPRLPQDIFNLFLIFFNIIYLQFNIYFFHFQNTQLT